MFTYLARLEVMIFFAGFTLVYAVVKFLAHDSFAGPKSFLANLARMLPYAYATNAVLFIGWMARKQYFEYAAGHSFFEIYHPYLVVWGILALLFWFPLFNKKPILCFVHSFVFLYFILRDIVFFQLGKITKDMLGNDMNILSHSMLLSVCSLAVVTLFFYLLGIFRKEKLKRIQ